nr:tetratricopeptide repeat protein [Anaerolineae bacterium]
MALLALVTAAVWFSATFTGSPPSSGATSTGPSEPEPPATAGPTISSIIPSITPSPTPTATLLPPESRAVLTVGTGAVSTEGTPSIAQMKEALADALQTIPGDIQVEIVEVTIPANTGVEDLLTAAELPGSVDILVFEQREAGGQPKVYILSAERFDLIRVDSGLAPVSVPAPGTIPIPIEVGYTYIAELAASSVEMADACFEEALERLDQLSPEPPVAGPDTGTELALAMLRSSALIALGNLEGAREALGQGDIPQDSLPVEALIQEGNIAFWEGDVAAAYSLYQAALIHHPGYMLATYNQLVAYMKLGNLAAALGEAEQIVEARTDAWPLNLRGYLFFQQDDYRAAYDDFKQAESLLPGNLTLLFNQAMSLIGQGNTSEALIILDSLIEQAPDDPVYRYIFGTVFELVGEMAQAEQAYTDAIDLEPAYIDAYLKRGWLRLRTENPTGAQSDAEQVIELDPEQGNAYALLGEALFAGADFTAALENYTEAIERDAGSAEIYARRGWIRHLEGNYTGALEDYEAAETLGYDEVLLLHWQGFALFGVERFGDALAAFLTAVNLGPATADLYAGLAVVLEIIGETGRAELAYQEALALDSRYRDVDFINTLSLWPEAASEQAESILGRLEVAP